MSRKEKTAQAALVWMGSFSFQLCIDPKTFGFKRNEETPLECNLLVVDEASMVDVPLMQSLLKAVPDPATLLIVGDID
jgi:exodeoxyribonuclease V alpha subunit